MYSKEEAKKLRLEFWSTYGRYCKLAPELRSRKKKWMLYDTKTRGLDLKFEVDRQLALVMIELNEREENRRLEMFEELERYKIILEEGFKDGLQWDISYLRESGQEVCRIYTSTPANIHRKEQWPDIFRFFTTNMLLLETNFLEIQEILQEKFR